MIATITLLTVAALAVQVQRWVRVGQREHYIAGSCTRVAGRWVRVRPAAGIGLLAALVACTGSAATRATDGDLAGGALAVVSLIAAAGFPWGMSVVGDPRLRLTRRASTLCIVVVALTITVFGLAFLSKPPVGFPIVVLVMPLIVDLALLITTPIEKHALERHRSAAASRLKVVSPSIIAVTGSYGKTTTKGHIRDLISGSASVVASPASWNNMAGLARTINEYLVDGTEVLVAEMGMYRRGEIRELTSWVPPDIAIITAIGPMHLERAGSIEAIVEGKAEILEHAPQVVLWVEDEHLSRLAADSTARVWRVGYLGREGLDVSVEVSASEFVLSGANGEIGRCEARPGLHAGNVGCAVAAALAFGIPAPVLGKRLATLTAPSHRSTSEVSERGVLVIDDTFNSNPSGARSALGVLAARPGGRRVVVTPGMVELGARQFEENATFASAALEAGADLVIVGWTNRRSLQHGAQGRATALPGRAAAANWVRDHLEEGDAVLWENDLPDHYP